MQENEKYGIELEAKTNLFKKGLQEAIRYTKAFGKGVKESFNDQVQRAFKEDFVFNDRDYQKRIDYIKDEMDAVMDQINSIKLGGKEGNLSELEKEYDRLTNKLEKLTNYQAQYNGELEETNKTSNKTSVSLNNLFDKSIGKIKRFTYYLLGARSVFSLFMRYRSIYYQYNEEMQYQSELSQNAIALSLAPAFEFLGNIITYASIGLAKFIELLTGVNVLSKVTTKGIRDYNKSLKETQTLVTGIDEITNLTNPQGLGLASQYQALDKFREKIAEVEEFFAKNEWIKKLAEGLKIVWNYLKENIWPIIRDNIFPAISRIVEFVVKIFDTIVLIFKRLGMFDYVLKPIWAIIKAIFHVAEFIVNVLYDILTFNFEQIGKDWEKLVNNIADDFDFARDKVKEGIEDMSKNLANGANKSVDDIIKKIEKITGKKYTIKFSAEVVSKIGEGATATANALSQAIVKSIRGYASGLDYVPYDNYPALLHKGEAVVPAKYNPTIHSQGNEYTNALLETLIYKVEDLASRPNIFEIDGQQFASATYGLYDNERKRQGYVEGVVR